MRGGGDVYVFKVSLLNEVLHVSSKKWGRYGMELFCSRVPYFIFWNFCFEVEAIYKYTSDSTTEYNNNSSVVDGQGRIRGVVLGKKREK